MRIPGLTLWVLWGFSSSQFARDWLNQILEKIHPTKDYHLIAKENEWTYAKL